MSSLKHRLRSSLLRIARSPLGVTALFIIALLEAVILPLAPDLLLIPMVVGEPRRAPFFAALTTLGTLCGALLGYLIGAFFMETLGQTLVERFGFSRELTLARDFFRQFHGYTILIAAFLPLPLKLFTLLSGAFHFPVLPYLGGVLAGRGARFFLVALGTARLGKPGTNREPLPAPKGEVKP